MLLGRQGVTIYSSHHSYWHTLILLPCGQPFSSFVKLCRCFWAFIFQKASQFHHSWLPVVQCTPLRWWVNGIHEHNPQLIFVSELTAFPHLITLNTSLLLEITESAATGLYCIYWCLFHCCSWILFQKKPILCLCFLASDDLCNCIPYELLLIDPQEI